MKVEFYKHNIGSAEIKNVIKVLNSLFLTTGSYVDEFENELSKYLSIKKTVGLTSCTAALHLACIAAGVKSGDEVITTPMSFVATSNSIIMAGGKPVFIDVEAETGNIDASLLENAITSKTRAIIPVHLYGQMVDMKKIANIANKYKLKVIEDSAHALEAERDGIKPGQKSFCSCFSFYATKSITSAEGGALSTNDIEAASLVKKLRSHGITSELAQRVRTGLTTYNVDVLGWKYNMDNLQGAMLIPQIKKANSVRNKRERIAKIYRNEFSSLPFEMPTEVKNSIHGRHIFPIWVNPKKRDSILNYLNSHGVGAVINYPAIHLFSFYRKTFKTKPKMFPNAERIAESEISLPIYSKLTDKEIEYIVKIVKKAVTAT